ncbi:tandem-95 repeat protein [Halomonas sp. DN3]|uniref:tandem-95 repeat protein n=1 Tax=Halomonas sp. DN3 TaxID=2953657 RepID=UPI00209F5C25|nr:tandem-95 repeat protein [Halomonas sp. DN3]USZ48270.1 tandem-95 repeat protein [Halomonas sp. DN3]
MLVDDDRPVTASDRASTDSDTPITVNVLDNDRLGADGGELDGAQVQGGSSVGQVSTRPDGRLTFTPDPDFSGNATIRYDVIDGDGDSVSDYLKVYVKDGNDIPTTPETDGDPDTHPAKAIVDEDGLPDGIPDGTGDIAGEATVATGTLGYDFGDDGRGSFRWTTNGLPSLTSEGSTLRWSLNGAADTLTASTVRGDAVIRVELTDIDSGRYRVELLRPLDHSDPDREDDINFDVGYTITDSDGDRASGNLRVLVDDDRPVTASDRASTDSDTPITVNVLDNDRLGADGGELDGAQVQGGSSVGQVSTRPDGRLTFTPDPDFSGNATIRYDVVDGDGDSVSDYLKVYVEEGNDIPTTPETDGDPDTHPAKAIVDEDGLPDGIPGGTGDIAGEATVATGTLGYDFGDDGRGNFRWTTNGLPSLTSEGSTLRWSLNGAADTLTASNMRGDTVIRVELTDIDSGRYRVELLRPLDHSDPDREDDINFNVGYTITDSDGDRASGNLRVLVDDDRPVTASDRASTDSDTPITVNVLDNDRLGADGGELDGAQVQGGSSVGQVSTRPDGRLTFTPDPDFSGNATIRYDVVDGDGDSVSDYLKVYVEEGNDIPTTPETDGDPDTHPAKAIVDEDGLPDGIPGGTGDIAGEATVATGTLGYDFGDDGRGSFRWTTNGLPSLTSEGSTLRWSLNGAADTLTASNMRGDTVIRVELTDIDSGRYRVELLRPLDHSDPDREDDINFNVGYTITDSDGDRASGNLRVLVDDDRPVTASDRASTDSDTPITVNVLDNDRLGADGGELDGAQVQGGSSVGQVSTRPDGRLTFTPDPDFSGNATIRYDVVDGDGDSVSDYLKVYVEEGNDIPTTPETDGDPDTEPSLAVLDEDGLPDGIPGGTGDIAGEATVATGTLGYDFGDDGRGSFRWTTNGLPSLTSEGSTLRWSLNGAADTLTASNMRGDTVIRVELTDIDSGRYRVELLRPLDHSDPDREDDINFNVGYTITDSDGDRASGNLRVLVDDDRPVTASDRASTDSDTPITVNVLDNDRLGADGGELDGAQVQGGSSVGQVSTRPDGRLTFTPNPDFAGNATIRYDVIDGDGDTSSDSLNIGVTLERAEDELFVGDNDDDIASTNSGNDVLIGDLGGKDVIIDTTADYNISLILDTSVTMSYQADGSGRTGPGPSRIEIAIEAIKGFAFELTTYEGTVNFNLVEFDADARSNIDMRDLDPSDLPTLFSYLDRISLTLGTNTESGLRKSTDYFDSVNNNAEDIAYLMTDGFSTAWLDNNTGAPAGFGNFGRKMPISQAIEAFDEMKDSVQVEAVAIGRPITSIGEPGNFDQEIQFLDNTDPIGTRT